MYVFGDVGDVFSSVEVEEGLVEEVGGGYDVHENSEEIKD